MQNNVQQMPYNAQQFRPMGYRVIPVANEAGMDTAPVEYNGTPTYFHNQSTDEICVRYFDIRTGITSNIKYVRDNGVTPKADAHYDEQIKAINERLDSMAESMKQPEERWGRK